MCVDASVTHLLVPTGNSVVRLLRCGRDDVFEVTDAQIERVRKFVNKTVIPNYQRGDRQPDDDDDVHDGDDGER